MSVSKAFRFEHLELRVKELDRALEFYTQVMGFVEIARADGVVYLGCGIDGNYDLAVRGGGTGVAHFAIRVDGEDDIERYAKRLADRGITAERLVDSEPGQELALRFPIPSGHVMELVTVKDNQYPKPWSPVHARRAGFGPLDADHISLVATDVRALAEFLRDVLDFKFSDISEPQPGFWPAAWTRWGIYHHDVGIFLTEDPDRTLHHVAWAMSGLDHMAAAADMLAQVGIRLELGPSRHPVGSNYFMYFWEPGGNRFELSAQGAILDPRTPVRIHRGFADTLDAWGTLHDRMPPTFFQGS